MQIPNQIRDRFGLRSISESRIPDSAPQAPQEQIRDEREASRRSEKQKVEISRATVKQLSDLFAHLAPHVEVMTDQDIKKELVRVISSVLGKNKNLNPIFAQSLMRKTISLEQEQGESLRRKVIEFTLWLDKLNLNILQDNRPAIPQTYPISGSRNPEIDKSPEQILDCLRLYYGVKYCFIQLGAKSIRVIIGPEANQYPIAIGREMAVDHKGVTSVIVANPPLASGKVMWVSHDLDLLSLRVGKEENGGKDENGARYTVFEGVRSGLTWLKKSWIKEEDELLVRAAKEEPGKIKLPYTVYNSAEEMNLRVFRR